MRVVEFLRVVFLNRIKELVEYKVNFYMGVFMSVCYSLLGLFFLRIVFNNFGDLLGWSFEMYVFYIIFMGLSSTFWGTCFFSSDLRFRLRSGDFSNYLRFPVNFILQHICASSYLIFASQSVIYCVVLICFFVVTDLFFWLRFLAIVPMFVFSGLFFVLIVRLFESLDFFLYHLRDGLYLVYSSFYFTIERFPVSLGSSKVHFLAHFCATFYYGFCVTQFYFGFISGFEFFVEFLIVVLLDFVVWILLVIMWRLGIRRQLAFG